MEKKIKILLAFLLLSCLLKMPYGYYQLVRFVSAIGFCILAYEADKKQKETNKVIFIILIILFQPIFKISLSRIIWNVTDVVVAIGLMLSLYKKRE